MKLLANENIPLASSEYLLTEGHDILHVGNINPSITDREVINWAIQEDRIILTFDRDYGTLVFKDGLKPPGVIYLRLVNFSPQYPGIFVQSLIQGNTFSFEGNFTVASEENIRQRRIG